MKTPSGRIKTIREELDVLEKQVEFLKNGRSDEQQMIDWLVRNIEYVIQVAERAQNSPGRISYAIVNRNMSSQLRTTLNSLRYWQEEGLVPDTIT